MAQIAGVEPVATYYTTDGYEDFTVNLSDYPDSDYLQKVIEAQKIYTDGENTTLADIPLTALGIDQWKDIERFLDNLSEGSVSREDFESGDFCILVLPPLGQFKTYDSNGKESVNYLPNTNPDLENGIMENTIKTGDFLNISHCVMDSEGVVTKREEQQIQVDAILRTMKYEDTYIPLLGSSGITIITGSGFWKHFRIGSVNDYYQIVKVIVSDDADALDTEAHIMKVLKKNPTIVAENNHEIYKAKQQSLYSFIGMFSIFAVFYLILVSIVLYQMAEVEAHQRRKSMSVFKALGMEECLLKRMRWTERLLKLFFSTITAAFILICYCITKMKF